MIEDAIVFLKSVCPLERSAKIPWSADSCDTMCHLAFVFIQVCHKLHNDVLIHLVIYNFMEKDWPNNSSRNCAARGLPFEDEEKFLQNNADFLSFIICCSGS